MHTFMMTQPAVTLDDGTRNGTIHVCQMIHKTHFFVFLHEILTKVGE